VLDHLGVILRTARKRGGVSALAIAAAAGVDRATVYRLERGVAWPRDPGRIVEAYGRALGAQPVDLWALAVRRWIALER
jgi:transcriptional regulator with XRE-family HTH domain